jgi:aldehyde dehydrogenase (NAD+)
MSPKFAEHTLMNILDVMYTERVPYGVSLLLGPFNYPIFLVFLPLIAMIAAGLFLLDCPNEYHTLDDM